MPKRSTPQPNYQQNGYACYLDPVSGTLRRATGEEKVRQECVAHLHKRLNVPYQAMYTECPVCRFKPGARDRMDIVVFGRKGTKGEVRPALVVECKAEDVSITYREHDQLHRYAHALGVDLVALTEGGALLFYRRDRKRGNGFKRVEPPKDYAALCTPGRLRALREPGYRFARRNHLNVWDWLEDEVGEDVPEPYWPFIVNLSDCLLDDRHRVKKLSIPGHKFLEDRGMRFSKFGNAAGGSYEGWYRHFLLRDPHGNTRIASLGVFATMRMENHPRFGTRRGKSCLNVAFDWEDTHHNALQLDLDANTWLYGSHAIIGHNGRLTAGKQGAVSSAQVIDFVRRHAPDLVVNGNIDLGHLDYMTPLSFASAEAVVFLQRLLRYALLRDDLRAEVTGRPQQNHRSLR